MDVKPGYKTSEFWLTLAAAVVGFVLASGFVPEGGVAAQVIGGAAAILAGLGYTFSRASVKNNN